MKTALLASVLLSFAISLVPAFADGPPATNDQPPEPTLPDVQQQLKDMETQVEKMQSDIFKDFDHSTFFANFVKDRSDLNSTLSFSGPKRVDLGDEVKVLFSIKGGKNGDYDIKVAHHQIKLTGKGSQSTEKKNQTKAGESESLASNSWELSQTYPIPADLDANHYRVDRQGDELSVIFHKLKLKPKGGMASP